MKKILLVEDDADVVDSLKEALDLMGYAVETAGNGMIALEICKNKDFDIILSDIKMPKMDGVTFISKLKEIKPNAVFIFMTGFTDIAASELQKLGPKQVLNKPFSIDQVVKVLESV